MGNQVFYSGMAFLMTQASVYGFLHHGVCYGMRKMLLQAGSKAEHLAFFLAPKGDHKCHPGARMSESTCFIKNYGVRFCHRLQKSSTLDSYMFASGFTHCREYCKRHGQLQGTGEINHEHG